MRTWAVPPWGSWLCHLQPWCTIGGRRLFSSVPGALRAARGVPSSPCPGPAILHLAQSIFEKKMSDFMFFAFL